MSVFGNTPTEVTPCGIGIVRSPSTEFERRRSFYLGVALGKVSGKHQMDCPLSASHNAVLARE